MITPEPSPEPAAVWTAIATTDGRTASATACQSGWVVVLLAGTTAGPASGVAVAAADGRVRAPLSARLQVTPAVRVLASSAAPVAVATSAAREVRGRCGGGGAAMGGPPSGGGDICLLYTSPSPRDGLLSRMPSS